MATFTAATGMAVRRGGNRFFISKTLFLALAAVLLALARPARAQYPPWCPSSSADSSTTFKSSSETASVSTTTPYGTCGTCYLTVYASEGMTRSKPGKPDDIENVNLYLSCYDSCASTPNGYSSSYITSDGSGIDIKKGSASVTATLQLDWSYNYGSGTGESIPQTATVNVQGTANGLSNNDYKCRYSSTYATPCATVVSDHSNNGGQYQSATFTGSITVGSTTYNIPTPAAGLNGNGAISKSSSITRTVVKNV